MLELTREPAKKVYDAEFKRSATALVMEQNYKPKRRPAACLRINLGTLKFWLRKYQRQTA